MSGRFCSAIVTASDIEIGAAGFGTSRLPATSHSGAAILRPMAARNWALAVLSDASRRAHLALGIEHGEPNPLGLDRPGAADADAGPSDLLDARKARQVFLGELQHRLGFVDVVISAGRIRHPLPHLVAIVGIGDRPRRAVRMAIAAARLPKSHQSIGKVAITSSSGGPPGWAGVKGRRGRKSPLTCNVGLGKSELVVKSPCACRIVSIGALKLRIGLQRLGNRLVQRQRAFGGRSRSSSGAPGGYPLVGAGPGG